MNAQVPKPEGSTEKNAIVDLWGDEPKKEGVDAEWLSEDAHRVNSKISKKRKEHNTTELKPIEIPHPGFSVNPTYGDHQYLLRSAVTRELEAIRNEEKLKQATSTPRNA